ncbi:MAG: Hsp70 family protein [Candidatus Brocadiia bacterium]
MADIGIDLGTTNSAVAYLRSKPEIIECKGKPVLPSAVAWRKGELLVGRAARDMAMVYDSAVSVKRDMGTDKRYKLGDKEYSPVEVSAIILRELKQAAEDRLGEPVDSAVITIPAYFSGAQKEATKEAGAQAGLGDDVRLLAEPIAAALAFGAEDLVLVYDLGGGTFDVGVIDCFDYTMLGLAGNNYLGGDDFDSRLMDFLVEQVREETAVDISGDKQAMQMAKNVCEKAKIELSDSQVAMLRYQTVVDGQAVNVMLDLESEKFESMIMDLVDGTIEKVEEALQKAHEKDETIDRDSIETVLLVGGSTYIPLVQRKLTEYFGREPSKRVNPDLAVALGAAIHTASGPAQAGLHRVRVDPVPEVTQRSEIEITGRTSPNAEVVAHGGASEASGTAEPSGKFSLTVGLKPDKINEIEVVATDANGEERRRSLVIRHDSGFSGQEAKPRKAAAVGGGVLPRPIGIRVTGQDDLLGVIIPEQSEVPCSEENRQYGIQSQVPGTAGVCEIELYEGDLPYAPLNTHLATMRLETAASPSQFEPVALTFRVTEDHLLTAEARMINFPDHVVTVKVNCKSPSGSNLHVVERADRVLNLGGEKLRPEDRARIGRSRQALLDLSEQYRRNPQRECYERIKQTGLELRSELDKVEAAQA